MKSLGGDIKNGTFEKVYLLYGSEDYFRQIAKKRLIAALLPDSDGMNLSVFSGKGCAESSIIEICDTLPFFAERRVVVVEDSGFFREKHEALTEYIKHLPDHLTLIFSESAVDKRGSLYKAVSQNGLAAEFSKPTEKELTDWLLVKLGKAGKKIRKSDMETFLSYVGENAGLADCEMEKLICYTGSREEIRLSDIGEICTRSLSDRIFEMMTDMTMGRKKEALLKYSDLLLMKEDPMHILYMIGRQFYQLLKIKELSAKHRNEKEIAEAAGMHPYAVKKGLPVSRRYTASELRAILEEFVSTEEDVKTGRMNPRIAAELMLLKHSKIKSPA